MSIEPQVLRPERSAHDSIRGYLYQALLGAQRWLELEEGEALLCEGDEDLDRLLLDGTGRLSEQVKASEKDLEAKAVKESVRNFLLAYATLKRDRAESRRFRFTSTATFPPRLAPQPVLDVVRRWQEAPCPLEEVAEAVRGWQAGAGSPKPVRDAVAWLDETKGWEEFVTAVEWHIEAPNLDRVRTTIASDLEARGLPGPEATDRLVYEILRASTEPEPAGRVRTRDDLQRLLETARTDLIRWAQGADGQRIRKLFDETAAMARVLEDKALPLDTGERNPGRLLAAPYEVVPFLGRHAELAALSAWCQEPEPVSVWLWTGQGGMGKTRLAIEACHRLSRQAWHTGFLRDKPSPEHLDDLVRGPTPRLVVVDYAETRPDDLRDLLRRLSQVPPGGRIRVLLLARQAGDWWRRLKEESDRLEWLLSRREPRELGPLVHGDPTREQVFREALEAFGALVPDKRREPETIDTPDLSSDLYERALYLHMAAYLSLVDDVVPTTDKILDAILVHERRFWRKQMRQRGWQVEDADEVVAPVMAGLALLGGVRSDAEAREAVTHLARTPPEGPRVPSFVALLRHLYAGRSGNHYLEGLQPDLLGEQLVYRQLSTTPELLERVIERTDTDGLAHALTVITRLVQRLPAATAWLEPVARPLASAVEESVSPDLAGRLMELCDQESFKASVPLREIALTATRRVLEFARAQATSSEAARHEFARILNNLGIRYLDLGRPEEALATSAEAVDHYRSLAKSRPDAFLPGLAMSLNNLGIQYSELGCREEALAASAEAVDHYRSLAKSRPHAFLPDLAGSLNNLGIRYTEVGRREEALSASAEAVDHYRSLAKSRPHAFLPNLAKSLNNLGIRYSELGYRGEALSASAEAVDHYRPLAESRPDVFVPDLAMSLNNLGSRYSELGRRKEALSASAEAEDYYRSLARSRPDAFLPALAKSLSNLGIRYSELGRREEALEVSIEAKDIRRELWKSRLGAFLPDLAMSLNNLGIQYSELGRRDEALSASAEAVDHYRSLAKSRPDAFLPDLAMSLHNLGSRYSELGRREEALSASAEAVDHYRSLAKSHPDAFLPYLAGSLNNLGAFLAALGRREEALAATTEAVRTLAPMFLRYPEALRGWMASCVGTYGRVSSELGQEPDLELLAPIVETLKELDLGDD